MDICTMLKLHERSFNSLAATKSGRRYADIFL